jgi:exosortase/archaeosortase family protein
LSELRVRVPATSANLGPGFDSFAVALPLLAEFEVRPARAWSVAVEGDGGGIPAGEDNLFVVGARAAAKAASAALAAQHVVQRSAIPLARGLGSSAAAIVGGALAANAILGAPLDRRSLLRVAADVEGHADNVAAALYGAFTIALPRPEGPVAARLAFPAAWRRRLAGLFVGFLAIQAVNLVRVVTLFWVGLHRPALFHSSHTVLWQSVVVLFGVLLFLFWAARESRGNKAQPQSG